MKTLNSRFVLLTLCRSPSSSSSRPLPPCGSHSPSSSCSSSSYSFRKSRLRRSFRPPTSSRVFPSPLVRRPADRFGNGSSPPLPAPSTFPPSDSSAASDFQLFLELMPDRMRREVVRHPELGGLIEVVLDLGRKPLARFPSGDWIISEQPVKLEDLRHAVSKVGDFSDDNRSGINSSLHRISAIRNRKMQIIGLTCRVGRAISGSAEMIRDLVESRGSILVIGPPGVGKTTLIREIARMLADDHKKRVVIIDTSNEIGGDGDVPHSGIGRARRMQVPNVNMQHNVMIEAVENHMPETIVIDEIGTELEALAAGTIAQRGVQLVGTAHGMTIESIIKNPSLQGLVGGIESVTLGDDEAKRRKIQKTILERRGPPTFTCAVEMISKVECRVHHNLEATVDAILGGKPPLFEVRHMDGKHDEHAHSSLVPEGHLTEGSSLKVVGKKIADAPTGLTGKLVGRSSNYQSTPVRLYTYKILEADLLQVTEVMGVENEIEITDDIGSASAVLALNSEIKQNPWIRGVAKFHQLPIFVIKKNTMAQMVKAIRMILGMDNFGAAQSSPVDPVYGSIEVVDDAPARTSTLEEIDALEVSARSFLCIYTFI
ncbi:unnamed protein product [Victoria cruziana]